MNSDEETCDYEELRKKNLLELEALLSSIDTTDIEESFQSFTEINQSITRTISRKRSRNNGDETFRFFGRIPLEKRKSARLSHLAPEYISTDLMDVDDVKESNFRDIEDLNNLEEVVYRHKKFMMNRKPNLTEVIPIEQVTEEYIANIAEKTTVKVYSQNGTSCHQCRQKTLDSKTYCRSGYCIGVRGQFCGVCLKNRYGEDAAKALRDPKWSCPPCRRLCNCSICRTREGKRPTGILTPVAFQHGHKSVKDFLISLKGKGDKVTEPISDINTMTTVAKTDNLFKSHHNLLGFNKDQNPIWVVHHLDFSNDDEYDCIGFNRDNKPCMIKHYK